MFKEGDILCSKYQLKKKFNKGGFSSVWLAYDLKAKEEFALKIYDVDGGYSEEEIEEFRKGFKLVVNLTHSNIFKPLSYDIQDNIPFLVMSYCANGSASSRIGKMSEDEVWRFAHDVSAGLAWLHDKKAIVHQDIKPGNILIDEDGKFMITDFDISTKQQKTVRMTAKQAKEMQEFNYGSGTPDYMGPERWPKEGYVPPVRPICASDIWSLGATLFELMTGEVPFGETGGAFQREYHAIPNIPGKYSKELKKLVRQCLSEEPWKRPSAQEIADAASLHKAPQSGTKHKYMFWGFGGVSVAMTFVATILMLSHKEVEPIFFPHDSIYIAHIEEAVDLVKKNSEDPNKYDNYAIIYTEKLTDAGKLYHETLALDSVQDSIRMKGEQLWQSSQAIIDDEYRFFIERERNYREMEAEAAADSFARRCKDLYHYVSDKLKL